MRIAGTAVATVCGVVSVAAVVPVFPTSKSTNRHCITRYYDRGTTVPGAASYR